MTDVPLDLYIAAYGDSSSADQDWLTIKGLAKDKVISVDALVLVSRDYDGTIHVKDNAHEAGIGAILGAVGGAVVGLIFPPTLLASAALGAGLGAGTGAIVDAAQKHRIKADIEHTLPPGSSGIVVIFEERWIGEVEKALAKAERAERHEIDKAGLDQVKASAGAS